MYVIVEIQGQQFKAEAGKKLFVHRLEAERGAAVEFDKVLLSEVVCEVLSHVRGKKVIVFKKKRRKGYRKRNGHRQNFTEVLIKEVVA